MTMRETATAARPNRTIPDDDTFCGCNNVNPAMELPAMVSAAANLATVLVLANDLI